MEIFIVLAFGCGVLAGGLLGFAGGELLRARLMPQDANWPFVRWSSAIGACALVLAIGSMALGT